jgi:hypothetical protein
VSPNVNFSEAAYPFDYAGAASVGIADAPAEYMALAADLDGMMPNGVRFIGHLVYRSADRGISVQTVYLAEKPVPGVSGREVVTFSTYVWGWPENSRKFICAGGSLQSALPGGKREPLLLRTETGKLESRTLDWMRDYAEEELQWWRQEPPKS